MKRITISLVMVVMVICFTSTVLASDTLVSEKVSVEPELDGRIDEVWSQAESLKIKTIVPKYDPANENYDDKWWDAYEGQEKNVTMKSLYTEDKIYFLIRWNDQEDSRERQAWYYNTKKDTWMQKPKYVAKDGIPPAYEDKFTVFWNLSIDNFAQTGCAPLCHGTKMRTNNSGEKADIWHWKRDRGGPVGEVDDKYLDSKGKGRHGDPGTNTYSYNVQKLKTASGDVVEVPKYWIPGREDYHWILKEEVENGVAKRIVEINKKGNLVDEAGNVLEKEDFLHGSPRTIPSLVNIKPGSGSRADVKEAHQFKDGMWTLEIVRDRDTGDDEHDIQFTEIGKPYYFSIGTMDSQAIAHSTPDGFRGTAYKLILANMK